MPLWSCHLYSPTVCIHLGRIKLTAYLNLKYRIHIELLGLIGASGRLRIKHRYAVLSLENVGVEHPQVYT